MIKKILTMRRMTKKSSYGYSWQLPIFDDIKRDITTHSGDHEIPGICLLYQSEVEEDTWEKLHSIVKKRPWHIKGVPFTSAEVKRLQNNEMINDDIIDGYLTLCHYLAPHKHFLPACWFTKINQSIEAEKITTNWVCKFPHTPCVQNSGSNRYQKTIPPYLLP